MSFFNIAIQQCYEITDENVAMSAISHRASKLEKSEFQNFLNDRISKSEQTAKEADHASVAEQFGMSITQQ